MKKGKSRRYVLLCKGATIVSLIVYKKGSVEKFKKKAKESGTGQLYHDVLSGKGMDINFQLARSEGFDKEPVRTAVLRSFLEEQAGFKCKPLFEIVDVPNLVLDEDDPLVAQFLKLQEAALAACDAHAERAGEISGLCRQIGGHLNEDQADQARERIVALEDLLKSLGTGGVTTGSETQSTQTSTPSSTTTSTSTLTDDESALAGLVESMKKLSGAVQTAIAQHPARQTEILGVVGAFRDRVKAKDLTGAQAALLAVGRLLKDLRGVGETAGSGSSGPTPGNDPMKVWLEAKEQCDEGITTLQTAVKQFDHPDLNRIAEFGLNGLTDGLQSRLMAAIMDLQRSTGEARKKAGATLAGRAAELRQSLGTDPIVELCEKNPFGVKVSIRDPLTAALTELERLAEAA